MATNYPAGLDSLTNPGAGDALTSPSHSGQHTNINDAVEAVQAELGTDPSGASATVKARLEAHEANSWVTTARIQDGAVTAAKTRIPANPTGARTQAISVGQARTVYDPGVYLSTLGAQQVGAHRCGVNHYGEQTMRSAEMSVRAGIKVLEIDAQVTSDGEVVCMHDTTVDRTTNGTGTVTAMTAAQIAALRVDLYRSDGRTITGAAYTPQRVTTPDEMGAAFRGRAAILVEDKAGWGSTSRAAAASRWRQAGLTDTFLMNSFTEAVAAWWAAAGFVACFVSNTDVADYAALLAQGITWVGHPMTGTGTGPELARIAAAVSAGMNVMTYTHTKYAEHQAAFTAGARIAMSDHPGHGAAQRFVTFDDGVVPAGVHTASGYNPYRVTDGLLRNDNATASVEVPVAFHTLAPAPQAARFILTFRHVGAVVGGTTTRWAGFGVHSDDAGWLSTAGGYHVLARLSGNIDIFSMTSGTGTNIKNDSTGTALAADTDYQLIVDIDATTITATVIDAATGTVMNTTSIADATHRAAWWPSAARSTLPAIGIRSCEVVA